MVTDEFRISDIKKIFGDNGKLFMDNLIPYSDELIPYKENDAFDLGGRIIRAYQVEGHTEGSMVLYDEASKTLFVGDALTVKETWVFLWYSTSLTRYYQALLHLKSLNLDVDRCLTGHLPNIMDYSLLDKKIKCVEKVLIKNETGVPFETFAGSGMLVEYRGVSIVYNPLRIK